MKHRYVCESDYYFWMQMYEAALAGESVDDVRGSIGLLLTKSSRFVPPLVFTTIKHFYIGPYNRFHSAHIYRFAIPTEGFRSPLPTDAPEPIVLPVVLPVVGRVPLTTIARQEPKHMSGSDRKRRPRIIYAPRPLAPTTTPLPLTPVPLPNPVPLPLPLPAPALSLFSSSTIARLLSSSSSSSARLRSNSACSRRT